MILDDGDICVNGVNIAARLQEIAEPRGIALSQVVADSVCGKVMIGIVDIESQQLKNIAQPVGVFRSAPAQTPAKKAAVGSAPAADPTPPLPNKPSIAVLPFLNMSGDPEQEYFADGIVEDILTALSRIHAFFVIARNAVFAYKGKSALIGPGIKG